MSDPGSVEAIEIAHGDGAVRGYCWPGGPDAVLLLHDVDADLDAWAHLPSLLAHEGYRVIAIDLPGHGLSDDPWRSDDAVGLVATLLRISKGSGAGRGFVIAAGALAPAALLAEGVDALVALSPAPPESPPPGRTPPSLILVGGADPSAATAADCFFRVTRGWAVISSFGTTAQATAIYTSPWGEHAFEQTIAFLNDYRSSKD